MSPGWGKEALGRRKDTVHRNVIIILLRKTLIGLFVFFLIGSSSTMASPSYIWSMVPKELLVERILDFMSWLLLSIVHFFLDLKRSYWK